MYLVRNKFTKDYIDKNGDWTQKKEMAKRFSTNAEARSYINSESEGVMKYVYPQQMEIIKESTTMKTFREFYESKKIIKEDKVYVFVAPYGNTMDVVKGEMQSTGGFKHTDSKFNYNRFPNEKPDATKSKLKSMGFKDSDIVIIQESATDDYIRNELEDVEDIFDMKTASELRKAIYHGKHGLTPEMYVTMSKNVVKHGVIDDLIEAILSNNSYAFDKYKRQYYK